MPKLLSSADILAKLRHLPGFEEGRQKREDIQLLGAELRALRASIGMSRRDAAVAAGIDEDELGRIETGMGKSGPTYADITKIIKAYNAELRDLKHRALQAAIDEGLVSGVSDLTLADIWAAAEGRDQPDD